MITKQRQVPLMIRKLEALLRRLPSNHPKRPDIRSDLAKWTAGYKGEQAVDYYLDHLPEEKYLILHDLRLPFGKYFFQIDTLLLSPKFILILEIKNIAGTLYFEKSTNQLIRSINQNEEGFRDPITQARRLRSSLHSFMAGLISPNLPIEYLIVVSNASTILKFQNNHPKLLRRVCHGSSLVDRISTLEESYKTDLIANGTLNQLNTHLINRSQLQTIDVLSLYKIQKTEILTGVQCPSCSHLPLNRKKAKWNCPSCSQDFKGCYQEAVMDYFLLIQSTITNSQLCRFLNLSSRSTGLDILSSLNLLYTGTKKARVYYSPI
ncbi:ribosomal protein L37AE/L43A [Peribacillus deserti]|uniref:Ribosomal protein L37AE/L43A n=1 Tax=Peribacillus deserti TaxID=673318 RepID=A0ABS2QJ39_9BACI|nr:nuclease-related domain-containing protein [Peribacillus deserti]MBM7692819.1 ribosomal protein L37AE/L43A [Peribacillus deserti]